MAYLVNIEYVEPNLAVGKSRKTSAGWIFPTLADANKFIEKCIPLDLTVSWHAKVFQLAVAEPVVVIDRLPKSYRH